VAAVLLVFSMGVSILGAAAPFVQSAPGQYTVLAAIHQLRHGHPVAQRGLQVVDNR
jgi:hypothetical protein